MTRSGWLTSTDPTPMLEFLGPRAADRQLRLFSCACCRVGWNPFVDPTVQRVVRAAEAFADGDLTAAELARARAAAAGAVSATAGGERYPAGVALAAAYAASADIRAAAAFAAGASAAAAADSPLRPSPAERADAQALAAERAAQADLVRDIFADPFRPARFDPSWRTTTAVALARRMYDAGEFGAMPILADALQDAGCDDRAVLDHCRRPAGHVRGCWVVDLVLGRS